MIRTMTFTLLIAAMTGCTMNDPEPPKQPASPGSAMIAGSVEQIDLDHRTLSIRDVRSGSRIAIDVATIQSDAAPHLSEVRAGDCATFSGGWKGDGFVATKLDSIRPGCR